MAALTDRHGRSFPYLRLSLLEACNFRCSYCLPDGYHAAAGTPRWLGREEIARHRHRASPEVLLLQRLLEGEAYDITHLQTIDIVP